MSCFLCLLQLWCLSQNSWNWSQQKEVPNQDIILVLLSEKVYCCFQRLHFFSTRGSLSPSLLCVCHWINSCCLFIMIMTVICENNLHLGVICTSIANSWGINQSEVKRQYVYFQAVLSPRSYVYIVLNSFFSYVVVKNIICWSEWGVEVSQGGGCGGWWAYKAQDFDIGDRGLHPTWLDLGNKST